MEECREPDLSEPVRPWEASVGVCVGGGGVLCVYNGCRERSVSPTLAPGLAQRKPLSVSLGCVYMCVLQRGEVGVVQQCDSSK